MTIDINTPERIVYLVSGDNDLGHLLSQQIGHFGYQVHQVRDFQSLEKAIPKQNSQAILVDMDNADDLPVSGSILENLQFKKIPTIPIMFISAQDDLELRLQAIRAGGKAFFHKPIDIVNLVDKLDEYDTSTADEPDRVMIIESQPTIGNYYQMVLKRVGITSIVVTEADQVLKTMAEFNPDLLLLDVYMPKISGMELTILIRQFENYVSIPIVFISNEDDTNKLTEILSLGGDDFLTKPIKSEQLIVVIKNRLRRSRDLREFMIHDSLTGLLNHTTYREHLKQEIAHCKRLGTGLALAMIDLDHFKMVNDTYGHSVGDSVLKSLSRLLKQGLRSSDIVGRHGGEEFVVILLNTDVTGAYKAIDNLRSHFSEIRHYAPRAGEFSVTFSCGLATYPEFDNVSSLSDAADRALYAAKAAGRNCIMAVTK